jgi:hypothetical protein
VFVGGGGGFVTGAVLKECKTAVVERWWWSWKEDARGWCCCEVSDGQVGGGCVLARACERSRCSVKAGCR